MEMLKGKTRHGFEYEFPKENIDMEVIDLIGALDENPAKLGKILEMLLGKEQKKALYDSIRDENGRVSASKGLEAFTDIMNTDTDTKNS